MSSYILTQLGVAAWLGFVIALLGLERSASLLVSVAMFGALVGGAVAWRMARNSFALSTPNAFHDAIGLRGATVRQVGIAAAVGLLLSAIGFATTYVFPPSSTQQLGALSAAVNEGGWARHVCAFFAVCIAPVVEEFVFRGVLFAGLVRRMSTVSAGLIAGVVFALMHVSSVPPYWPALVAVLLLALAAQLARVRTGTLVPGVVMHTLYNAALFVAAYAGDSSAG